MNNVKILLNYPKHVKYGENFKINVNIINDSNEKIIDVKVLSQEINHDFGDIDINQLKSQVFEISLPSVEDLKRDFGENINLPKEFYIGRLILTFKSNGKTKRIESEELIIDIY